MTKNDLTANQRMVLEAAANRDDHAAWPIPKLLGLSKGSATLVIRSLLKKGLVRERQAGDGDAVWREDDDGQVMTLVISEAGLEALGLLPDEDAEVGPEADAGVAQEGGAKGPDTAATGADTDQPRQPRPGTKLAALVALLSRPGGATVDEMVAATGWQAHSVRGVMSGALTKRFGLHIVSEKVEGRGRVYKAEGS